MPSLEERAAQMEHILRSSVVESRYGETGWEHREPDLEVLKEVVDSKYTVFDVLPIFFGYQDPWVSLAALEVYIRRAYRAYSLKKIEYHNESSEPPFIVTWDFVLRKVGASEFGMPVQGSAPSTPATPSYEGSNPFKRVSSISDMSYLVNKTDHEPNRKGVIVPVQYLDEAEEYLLRALEVLPCWCQETQRFEWFMPDLGGKRKTPAPPLSSEDELTAVCNVAVRDAESMDDKETVARINLIIKDYKEELLLRRIRRLTFICGHKDGSYPGYYTFRGPEYEEDQSIRHIEPALAFQLELGRLSKFNIKPVFAENRNIHIYEAVGKASRVTSDTSHVLSSVLEDFEMRFQPLST
jgi:acetyl-CoA carboxylase/biotin carboxylase 1